MAKKQQSSKLAIGTRVRVKPNVTVPEFPDVPCGGWTGSIDNLIGKSKPDPKYVVEWDEETIARMPPDYRDRCEKNGLFFRMACLSGDQIEPLAE